MPKDNTNPLYIQGLYLRKSSQYLRFTFVNSCVSNSCKYNNIHEWLHKQLFQMQ